MQPSHWLILLTGAALAAAVGWLHRSRAQCRHDYTARYVRVFDGTGQARYLGGNRVDPTAGGDSGLGKVIDPVYISRTSFKPSFNSCL